MWWLRLTLKSIKKMIGKHWYENYSCCSVLPDVLHQVIQLILHYSPTTTCTLLYTFDLLIMINIFSWEATPWKQKFTVKKKPVFLYRTFVACLLNHKQFPVSCCRLKAFSYGQQRVTIYCGRNRTCCKILYKNIDSLCHANDVNTQTSLFATSQHPSHTRRCGSSHPDWSLLVRSSKFCPTSQNSHSCLTCETKWCRAKS